MMATFRAGAAAGQGTGVAVNVVHPGVVATSFGALPGPIGWAWRLGRPFMITPEQGRGYAAASGPFTAGGGRHRRVLEAAATGAAQPPGAGRGDWSAQLWRETERLVG